MPDNHLDPIGDRRPLPLRETPDLQVVAQVASDMQPYVASIQGPDRSYRVGLITDSDHLANFYSSQWPEADDDTKLTDGLMVALKHRPSHYGLPDELEGVRSIDPDRTLIVSFANEYYGNVKISTRGLCSAACTGPEQVFLHGTAIKIGGQGLVISGASGAGKTTTTAALRRAVGESLSIVNDDWGAANVHTRSLWYTGETRLHMKYRSVGDHSPDLDLSPLKYPSENYAGDPTDPHARLLIEPERVFGPATSPTAEFSCFIAILRDPEGQFSAKRIDRSDLGILEESQYSAFYGRYERFMDGSLLDWTPDHFEATRTKFGLMIDQIPSLLINNNGEPTDAAHSVLRFMDQL